MKTTILLAAGVLLAAAPALAQKPSDCNGTLEVIRFSALKPGKTIADFQKAVDMQMAWYRRHGTTNNSQIVAPVMTASGIDPSKVVTIHINAPGVSQDARDAGWDDFVAAFREVSTVETMHAVCLPK